MLKSGKKKGSKGVICDALHVNVDKTIYTLIPFLQEPVSTDKKR